MSKEYIIDSDENSDYMYDTIKNICEKVGPRMPCSENERKASEMLAKELEDYCDEVEIEGFETYPRALYGWISIAIGIAGISYLIFLLSPLSPLIVSAICLILSLFVLFMVYKHLIMYDLFIMKYWPFFKKKKSQNVIGTIKPTGEVKKRVVFSGHIDSAGRFNLMHYFRDGYLYVLIYGLVSLVFFIVVYLFQLLFALLSVFSIQLDLVAEVISLIFSWIVIIFPYFLAVLILVIGRSEKLFYGVFQNIEPVAIVLIIAVTAYNIIMEVLLFPFIIVDSNFLKTATILIVNGLPAFLLLFFLFASKKHAVMGATDNLSAVAPAMCIAKILNEWKNDYPDKFPKNTEVKIAILGCEEPGCRGAEAFAIKHAAEYNKIDTTCVNFESLTETKHQGIFNKEGVLDFDKDTVDLLAQSCEELGYKHDVGPCPPIAGGTDARGLVKYGLRASSLIGLQYKWYLHYYHTDRDNMEIINKERKPLDSPVNGIKDFNVRGAMEMALKVSLKYLEHKDKE